MKRFIEGFDRSQTTLLPDCVDDYVGEDNPVRAIDAFVDMLDLASLGFDVAPEATGRPGYHPSTMLKLYLYGYFNQVQSSRRLERECGRNLELIWLMGRLKPDFKTIADFRRDNGPAIRQVCRQFVALCRDIDLLDASVVAIDGSKFKAVNAKAKSYTREKIERRLGETDAAITRYLGELDRADEVHRKTGMMAHKAQAVMASETIEAIADKGYYKGEEIVACEQDGIAVIVSKPHTSNASAVGRFDKADFIYHPDKDAYLCPAGEWLPYHYTNEEAGRILRNYWTNVCGQCPVKAKCTTGKERRVKRWEHEAILDRVQKRLDDDPAKIPLRSKTVEHPFGTIKAWMGATHFKMKTMKHVATEMALHVIAYNMMRVISILGVPSLLAAMRS